MNAHNRTLSCAALIALAWTALPHAHAAAPNDRPLKRTERITFEPAYEQVASAAVGTTEAIASIDVAANPGRFVAAGGTIRARVRSWAGAPVFANPWSLSTDHIFWELTP